MGKSLVGVSLLALLGGAAFIFWASRPLTEPYSLAAWQSARREGDVRRAVHLSEELLRSGALIGLSDSECLTILGEPDRREYDFERDRKLSPPRYIGVYGVQEDDGLRPLMWVSVERGVVTHVLR